MKARSIASILGLVGLVAAGWFGWTTFRHLRRHSNDGAVCSYQIFVAAETYFFEHPEKSSVSYDELIRPDGNYIKAVRPVDGEDYHELFPIPRTFRELILTMGDGRRVIVFDRTGIYQDADGRFLARHNREPAVVENYRRWLAAGRPPATHR